MALIVVSVQVYFDSTDGQEVRDSLIKSYIEAGFAKVMEAKDGSGKVIACNFTKTPQIITGVQNVPMNREQRRHPDGAQEGGASLDNLLKFNPAGGEK